MKMVSIILSCFNGTELIKDYMDSILDENIIDVCQLIAVDFPFSHHNPEYVEAQLRRYPHLLYLPQEKNITLYDAWNLGIKSAKTEFVANLNLDDRVDADYYAVGVNFLVKKNADVFSSTSIMTSKIGCLTENQHPQLHLPDAYFCESDLIEYGGKDLVYQSDVLIKKRNPPHCAPIWRKSLHEELGWFDSSKFDFSADFEFWLRVGAAGKLFLLFNKPMTLFYAATGTASDRLMHHDSSSIINYWEATFPYSGYKETHLGRPHDLLHHCMNMNTIFSRRDYFIHLSELVSVVVTAHDKPEELSHCLQSIKTQSYFAFECIVVLDSDNTGLLQAVVSSYTAMDKRFRSVVLDQRVERNYARNVAITLAIGKWVCFVDGDDLLTHDSLKVRVSCANNYPNDIPFGGLAVFTKEQVVSEHAGPEFFDFNSLRLGWPSHCTLLIPRKLLTRVSYPASKYDFMMKPSEIAGEDVKFMMSLLKFTKNSKMINAGGMVYNYRRHFSSSYSERQISIFKVIAIIIDEFGLPGSDDDNYRGSLCSRLLNGLFWAAWNNVQKDSLSESNKTLIYKCIGLLSSVDLKLIELVVQPFIQDLQALGHFSVPNLYQAEKKCINLLIEFDLSDYEINRISSDLSAVTNRLCPSTPITDINQETVLLQKKITEISLMEKPDPCVNNEFNRLLRFKNVHRGGECLILCNGPSLRKVDFSKLDKQRFKIIGLNKIFLGFDMLNVQPDYIVAINKKVIEQSSDTFKDILITKFLSNRCDLTLNPADPFTYHINTAQLPKQHERFSKDIPSYVHEGWTVTHAALQIAYYMGFSKVYIVGMDHRFTQHIEGQENKESMIVGEDKDHFHPGYFGNGQAWDFPDLKNSEISYEAARKVYEEDGRAIYDCTIDGACTVFKKKAISTIYKQD